MDDRLYRSRTDRVISGVAGGLAERLAMDPSVVRVVWVVLAFVSGGLFALVYLVMMVVVPEAPDDWPASGRGAGGFDPWSSPAATGVRPTGSREPPAVGEAPASGRWGAPDPPIVSSASTLEPGTGSDDGGDRADVGDDTAAFTTPLAPPAPEPRPWTPPPSRPVHREHRERGGGLVLGLILILIGGYFLVRQYIPQIDLDVTWPVVVVIVGVLLVLLAFLPGRSRS